MIHRYMKDSLKRSPLTGDHSVYVGIQKPSSGATRLFRLYVGDSLGVGTNNFEQLTDCMSNDFELKPRAWDGIKFFGMHMSR